MSDSSAIPAERFGTRRRLMAILVVALGLIGSVALSAAPANAWSSVASNQSPSGCSGGFAGSSYKPTSTTGYASVSNAGSNCDGTRPQGGAAIRYSNGTFIAVCVTTATKHSCTGTMSVGSGAVGGYHDWGTKSISS